MPTAKPPISLADAGLPSDRPFSFADARRHGVTSADLRKLIRIGALHRIFQGVYAAFEPETSIDRARALALAVPESAIVIGRSAGWLYGMGSLQQFRYGTYPPSVCWSRAASRFDPGDLCSVEGCQVTTPLRTACDLGRTEPRAAALGALDAGLRLGKFSHDQLHQQVPRFRGRSGVGQLRELVGLADPLAETLGESALRACWLDTHLPVPQLHAPIVDDGRVVIRLQLADPAVRYAAEFDPDGDRSTAQQSARHDARRIAVDKYGWMIDVFGPGDALAWGGGRDRLIDGHGRARRAVQHGTDSTIGYGSRIYAEFGGCPSNAALAAADQPSLRYEWSVVEDRFCNACGQRIERGIDDFRQGVERQPL